MTKNLRITVEGKTYDVTVEIPDDEVMMSAPRSASGSGGRKAASASAPPPSAPAPKPVSTGGAGEIASPLSGVVSAVNVKVGDVVKEGDAVVTLEAMKMMTSVPASEGGTVQQVLVSPGQSVEEGQPLIIVG